jgi:hypothetical protein
MDNEMSKSTNLPCIQKNIQIIYIARDFSFNNILIFNEIMFFYYVNKVFPVTNPSFDGVKFTSELNLADIDCMKKIEPTFDLI